MFELILTDANFDKEVLQSPVPVLVDFWAPWCGPCQVMGPVVEQIAKELEGKNVKIAKLNVDDNPVVAGKYNVLSIPTFLVFKGGQMVEQMIGGVPKDRLKGMVEKHIV
ncbi:MAG: thioredoxin [Patescibacteria group bacterium]